MHSHRTLLVHIVWATKHRERTLTRDLDAPLASLLASYADACGCRALGVGVAPDHVHVLASLAPHVTLATLVQQMKGGCSHDLAATQLAPSPVRWQSGYWAESCSPAAIDPLLTYLRHQRAHHAKPLQVEPWRSKRDD